MPEQTPAVGMERKLAAIFSPDVVGYSRLMGDDEEATIRTLTAYREVISSLVQHYRGRVVDAPGDNLLAEFASVVDAVRCAVDIQQSLKTKNADLLEHRQMQFRIGINLGDVIVEGERLYGDGVNIAARLEGLAEPGGIYISGTVYDQVKSKLTLSYEDLGPQQVKNIAEPVRVYRVGVDESSGHQVASHKSRAEAPKPHRMRPAHQIRAGLVLLAVVGAAVRYWLSPIPSTQHPTPSTSAALPLPDKPSIAVLPFTNMSGDPGQEYFSDGMTEDLITDLSKISGLFVIARNSTFVYKSKPVDIRAVSRELGVQYVLEGSVQKASDRLRINAQLVDATTGAHVWAERYDRALQDLFALQDEVGQKIVFALKVKLTPEEQARFRRFPTNKLEAYDVFLRGWEHFLLYRKETNAQARQMFEQAIELDPTYAAAYVTLGGTYWLEGIQGWSQDSQVLEQAFTLTQKAIALDDSLSGAHVLLGDLYLFKKQYDQAIAELERAIALDPNNAFGYLDLGMILIYVGRSEETIGLEEKAMRLDPHYPVPWLNMLGYAYHGTGRDEEAIGVLKKALARNPDFLPAHINLAVIYSERGQEKEAREETAEILRLNPQFSLEATRQTWPIKDPVVLERHITALRKAGLR